MGGGGGGVGNFTGVAGRWGAGGDGGGGGGSDNDAVFNSFSSNQFGKNGLQKVIQEYLVRKCRLGPFFHGA